MNGNDRPIILQDRDRHLLRELAVMRVIDREQAKCIAGFGSTTRANTRLLALTRAKFLRRFFLGSSRGASKAIYALSPAGAKLVEVPYRGPRRGRDETIAADFFVNHQMRINELYCTLKYQPAPIEDLKFLRWIAFHDPIEPGASLIPDGYLEFATHADTLPMFVEVDLGHESGAVWRRKVQEYVRYAISGHFAEKFGRPRFRTLVVTTSERRLKSLIGTTATITDKIFWFTTFEAAERDGFWSAIWRRASADKPQALLQLP